VRSILFRPFICRSSANFLTETAPSVYGFPGQEVLSFQLTILILQVISCGGRPLQKLTRLLSFPAATPFLQAMLSRLRALDFFDKNFPLSFLKSCPKKPCFLTVVRVFFGPVSGRPFFSEVCGLPPQGSLALGKRDLGQAVPFRERVRSKQSGPVSPAKRARVWTPRKGGTPP